MGRETAGTPSPPFFVRAQGEGALEHTAIVSRRCMDGRGTVSFGVEASQTTLHRGGPSIPYANRFEVGSTKASGKSCLAASMSH